ncbi:CGNR zinc finger domain-containing protein [Sulfobacillus thermosulfidooxidans]|nr:CGNR zinc finger domain-containing protein [Sulfobacillus thermosulfidooxidans]
MMDTDESLTLWTALVNTRYLHDGHEVDDLKTPEGLLDWIKQYFPDIVSSHPVDNPIFIGQMLQPLRDLREICLLIATALTHHTPLRDALKRWNQWLEDLNLKAHVIWNEGQFHEVIHGVDPSQHILWRISHSLAETLQRVPSERIRQCEDEQCIRYFVDTSRGGHRRWCNMATCGNRQKVARYRAKNKGSKTRSGAVPKR